MHQDDGCAAARDDVGEPGLVPQAADVVDDGGARGERGVGRRRSIGVDGDRHVNAPGKRLDDRNHAAVLLRMIDRRRTRPCRFAPDVDDAGALLHHVHTGVNSFRRVEKHATVRKRVGCHVDDAHDDGALAERQRVAAG